ncbi:MAG: nuclear transport factor 2 family protein [Halioglobus sp.]
MIIETGSVGDLYELQNQLAIQQVIFTHCRGLDRLDAATLLSCYWPDAEVDYGSFKGPADTFCNLVVEALPASYELTQHKVGNTLVDISASVARAETYVTAYHLLLGAQQEMVFSGRYLDRLEMRDDCWKILHRTVVIDWSRNHVVKDERESEAFAAMQKGGVGDKDPLPTFLNNR